LYLKHSFYL